MHTKNYQEIYRETMGQIQTPTRYMGNEINAVKKDFSSVDLTVALVFPDLYEIGTSHFGIQILYSILNSHDRIAAERFFAPAPDMEAFLQKKEIPCLSMESQKELKSFDFIGVSLLYELNFTNILTLFKLSGIPFFADQRDDTFPLIIGGGPCAFNPEPLADFFDAFVIGDGEETIVEISETIMAFKKQGDGSRQSLLKEVSKIDGVYVPSFFNVSYDTNGIQALSPIFEDYKLVKRAILPELTQETFPDSPVVPYGKPVHDRLRLEIARGCSRGCRFCQAGMIYRPVRERSLDDLVEITQRAIKTTGYSDVSLLSLSTGDYSNLAQLMTRLMALDQGHCNAISLPSIRAEKLTPALMDIIKTARKTGFTIAPEAGTQRLRDVINKNLTKESIHATVENALALGWKNIKLYFMMGLPFETMEDIDGICSLSTDLAVKYAKGKKNINVSTTSFIPKAHTPFERVSQISLEETKEKLQYLKDNLKHRKVKLKWQDPSMSQIEGVWARGDRRLSSLLVSAHEKGCRLDGWSDKFNYDLWQKAFDETGIDPQFYTTRHRGEDERLPWAHIDSGVSQKFLKKEYKKAQEMALTPDCRENDCTGCGICDFKKIQPVLNTVLFDEPVESDAHAPIKGNQEIEGRLPDEAFIKYEITFSKLDNARFFGHLELATIFRRAVRRAGLAVKYSKGFNPSMRLSFENALPVGMESEQERLFIYLEKGLDNNAIVSALNRQLPSGIKLIRCRLFNKSHVGSQDRSMYTIRFKEPCLDQNQIDAFLKLSDFIMQDLSKKGKIRKTDLRKSVESICFLDEGRLEMVLKRYNERTVRPQVVLEKCFEIAPEKIQTARILKKKI